MGCRPGWNPKRSSRAGGGHRYGGCREACGFCNQTIRSGGLQLSASTVAPKHTKSSHLVRVSSGYIISTVTYHNTVVLRQRVSLDDMGNKLRLVFQSAARFGAIYAVEKGGKIKMLKDT